MENNNSVLKKEIVVSLKSLLKYIKYIVIFLIILYLLSGFYIVKSNEIAIVERFGKIVSTNTPGINYSFPWPIDVVKVLSVKEMKTVVIERFDSKTLIGKQFFKDTGIPPYLITGDNNIVTLKFKLKYSIINPVDYWRYVKEHEELLKYIASTEVLHYVAKSGVDQLLTSGKKRLESQLKKDIQKRLDNLKTGVGVTFVELDSINPPLSVQKSFDDVINASIDGRKVIHDAERYRDKILPQTRSKAAKIVQKAEIYKQERIKYAEGEGERFLKQYESYKLDKEGVYKNLFLTFIQKTFLSLDKVVLVDTKTKTTIKFIEP